MKQNITDIPTGELMKDLKESLDDIKICENALSLIPPIEKTRSGGDVKERLEINKKIVEKIKIELKQRGFDNY